MSRCCTDRPRNSRGEVGPPHRVSLGAGRAGLTPTHGAFHGPDPSARGSHRRPAHTVLPLEHALRRPIQSGYAGRRAERLGRQVQAGGRAYRRSGGRRRRFAFQGLEPGARGGPRHQAGAQHAWHHHAAGLRHQPAGCHVDRRENRHGSDRERHCHGLRYHLGCAHRVQAEVRASPRRSAERQVYWRAPQGFQGFLASRARTAAAFGERAAHGPLHGPAHRADGAGVEDRQGRAGPARLREP